MNTLSNKKKKTLSEDHFGAIWAFVTILLIIVFAMSRVEKPLFLYKKIEGKISGYKVRHISYYSSTKIAFDAFVIDVKEKGGNTEQVIFYYDPKYDFNAYVGKEIKAWCYVKKGYNKSTQIIIDGSFIRKYNENVGIWVYIFLILLSAVEIFMVYYSMKKWPKWGKKKTKTENKSYKKVINKEPFDYYEYCPACGFKLKKTDKECPDCGLNLS
jgi:hypothetical protein